MKSLSSICFLLIIGCASKQSSVKNDDASTISRPAFHFTPEKNWTNDPNGLVYFDGEYHLFYQYNPYGKKWGHMSWGHAVSSDLVTWKHLPVALGEYTDPSSGDSTMIFSGTAVVDRKNTAGFGKDAMVAIYTSHVHKGGNAIVQHQSLAYSLDRGRSWKRYDKNPVLTIGRKDFRDPKVFWYEPEQKWVMAVVVPDQFTIQFYESRDLKQWAKTGEFGHAGDTLRIWECPDLFQLPVEGDGGNSKWVLSLSGSHPQGPKFVGMQYFVGEFDGKKFTVDNPEQAPRYVNYGKDFYAGIVFNQLPSSQKRTVMIGWVNNWTYANDIPANSWRGAMSIPRALSLKKFANGYRLIQGPVKEMAVRASEVKQRDIDSNSALMIELELSGSGASGISIGNDSCLVRVGCDFSKQQIFLDRSLSKKFHPDFPSVETAPAESGDSIGLIIYIDQYITEVFSVDGRVNMTDLTFFPKKIHIETFGNAKLKTWKLN
ncbi:MAG TPA: glycoside hydrolase family 32 protein [Cyclobacteriaceae bacterium]|jgi:fructan beta-fructosidase|nr:glycoside hydrolase family 32 protein [Cyclobacteriaceae bacterium]